MVIVLYNPAMFEQLEIDNKSDHLTASWRRYPPFPPLMGCYNPPFYGKNGVVDAIFVVNSGFEKVLPFLVEDRTIVGHQNEPFCRERKAIFVEGFQGTVWFL